MRLALFSADRVGVAILDVLLDQGITPACLVIHRKDPGHCNTALSIRAREAAISHILSNEDLLTAAGLRLLQGLELDLGVLAWWPDLIKKRLIEIPRLGFINLHPSLLPFNRGKDPNFWALRDGTPFGVTIHHVNNEVDSGDIAFQQPLTVEWEDTGESLYLRATEAIVELFRNNLANILRGELPRIPQALEKGTLHRRSELDPASRIELDQLQTARSLLNLIRARTFPGHPAAYFEDNGDRFEVRAEIRRVPPSPEAETAT